MISQIDGDQSAQTNVLKKQADQLAKQLVSTSMPIYYVKIFQQCSNKTKLIYPLAASTITNNQLDLIKKKIHPEALSSMGYN